MVDQLIKFCLFLLSLPFRFRCKHVARSAMIGPGYSFFGCNLENVTILDNVKIGSGAWIQTVVREKSPKPAVIIAENTNIGRNVVISAAKNITIGKNTLFSYAVSLIDHNHAFEDTNISPLYQGIDDPEDIVIGEDCFIGAHSFILKGVVLGKHCVVGANSVVDTSFPAYSVIAGSPAKLIRSLKHG
ncbi:MAG: DapH/DapD/GlmU-related protein [Candidatus Omnitrophica bacterium]|nr:DapH/DapD/GlmU-related protein [Candidatus Omnitrophota bacterium]MDD5236199.1 DapH/DapD/GlmU-related protein [Candidatus Omnitrophota bacterium]MDD5610170.1 DapH/DapD/GlmU-related protein [Candidatus Omnitrophota bacterium]